MTNHHVVEDLLAGTKDPKAVVLRFDYEVGTDGAQFYTKNHLNVPLMLGHKDSENKALYRYKQGSSCRGGLSATSRERFTTGWLKPWAAMCTRCLPSWPARGSCKRTRRGSR